MKKQQFRLAVLCLLLAACSQFPAQAGVIIAINHTKWAINRFSVDGNPGIDNIGPYQGGGGRGDESAETVYRRAAIANRQGKSQSALGRKNAETDPERGAGEMKNVIRQGDSLPS
ncbi:hypothetical protein C5471_22320 [Photorhabdus tasmaniensis]|uniref:Lipoprotein n=1 Tax=Photorhabdus tasmaniensis TaxID=1004159 RepID=A0ABX0GQ46_9GAMM|nr:hypothetical protein [Photorhabdus tasmaniensis]